MYPATATHDDDHWGKDLHVKKLFLVYRCTHTRYTHQARPQCTISARPTEPHPTNHSKSIRRVARHVPIGTSQIRRHKNR